MTHVLLRLRRRKIVQWALAYLAGAFALIQVVDVVGQRFDWPAEVMRIGIVALAIGFFVALVLAWYHGERGAQRVTGAELVILALLLGIGGVVLAQVGRKSAATRTTAEVASAGNVPNALPIQPKSIAVLPFENLSADKDNAYFAGGMRDEILTRLAGIHDLKVISRTSTEQYASHPSDIKTVAAQLGVAAVLEGSVQKAGDSAHINLQLIDTRTDSHLWADSYDRDLKNLFAVEREVAEKVAHELRAQLLPDEANLVADVPTENSEAHDLYLRGMQHYSRGADEYFLTTTEMPRAIPLFEQALQKDPNYALAASALSKANIYVYWFGPDRSRARLDAAQAYAERALALQPKLGDAHYARGIVYYWGHRDYPAARREIEMARETLPNNEEIELTDAAISRRMGDFPRAIAGFRRASALSPRSSAPNFNLAQTYMMLRQYAEADRLFARAAEVTVDPELQLLRQAENRIFWTGDRTKMEAILSSSSPEASDAAVTLRLFQMAYWKRDFAGAERTVGPQAPKFWYDATNIALSTQLYLARAYARAGDHASAQPIFEAMRRDAEASLADAPDVAEQHLALALADLGLGKNDEAIAEGRKAADAMPISTDAFTGPGYLVWLAKIYMGAGQNDAAIDLLDKTLAVRSGNVMSRAMLEVDSDWDSLRGDPRFQALVKRPDVTFQDTGGE